MGGIAGGRAAARREGVLVFAIVVAAALFVMGVSVPANWQPALERAETMWGLPVSDVGRWFSGWAFGDGQAFAVIASDPLGQGVGATLGWPGYRYMRFGFGWLVGLVSMGNPAFIPYAITAVGLVSLAGLFVLATRLRSKHGPLVWLLCLNPAVFVAIAGGTAESLGVLLLALSLATGGWWWALTLGTVRPTYFVALVRHPRSLVVGLVTVTTVALVAALQFGWDLTQYTGGTTWPLVGYFEGADPGSWLAAICASVTVVLGVRHRNLAWVLSGFFVLCFSADVVENFRNTWRAAGMLPVLWALARSTTAETTTEIVVDLTDRAPGSVLSGRRQRTMVG